MSEELPSRLLSKRSIEHQIDLILGSTLPNLPHYRMNPQEYKILQEIVDDSLSKQLIQHSLSPCVMPTLIVPKKDRKWQLCVDSQTINKIIVKYRFLMPWIEDLIDKQQDTKLFSKIDLCSGYYQLRI